MNKLDPLLDKTYLLFEVSVLWVKPFNLTQHLVELLLLLEATFKRTLSVLQESPLSLWEVRPLLNLFFNFEKLDICHGDVLVAAIFIACRLLAFFKVQRIRDFGILRGGWHFYFDLLSWGLWCLQTLGYFQIISLSSISPFLCAAFRCLRAGGC